MTEISIEQRVKAVFAALAPLYFEQREPEDQREIMRLVDFGLIALADAAQAKIKPLPTRTLPVTEVLKASWPKTRNAFAREVLASLRDFLPIAYWRQNPNYATAPDTFLSGYGYVELIGPGAYVENEDVRLGILALAPHVLYPAHSHPAREVYYAMSSGSRWWREGESWRVREAGEVIYHSSERAHASQAGAEPLVAIYVWRGQVSTEAVFSSERGTPLTAI